MYLALYQMVTSLFQADNSVMIDVSKRSFVNENRTYLSWQCTRR